MLCQVSEDLSKTLENFPLEKLKVLVKKKGVQILRNYSTKGFVKILQVRVKQEVLPHETDNSLLFVFSHLCQVV